MSRRSRVSHRRIVRLNTDTLESRVHLATNASIDATQLLHERVRDHIGIAAEEAAAIVGGMKAVAPHAAGLTLASVPYLAPLTASLATSVAPTIQALSFGAWQVDRASLKAELDRAGSLAIDRGTSIDDLPEILLPTPDGNVARFGMDRYDLLGPATAAEHPDIVALRLFGLDDRTASGTAVLTSNGFDAFVTSPSGDWRFSPVDVKSTGPVHASWFLNAEVMSTQHDPEAMPGGCGCLNCLAAMNAGFGVNMAALSSGPEVSPDANVSIGTSRKNLRIVVGTTAEWTAGAGGQSAAFAQVTSMVNAINAAFLRDVCVQLQLVSTTATIYTNASTDGYTDGNTSALANENQAKMDAAYGFANYDIGHVFGSNVGSGVATVYVFAGGESLGNVGSDIKAKGTSNLGAIGSSQLRLTFAHEVGHQLGANHTFNNLTAGADGGRSSISAYEPGPGSTIMGYGGLGWQGNFVTVTENYYHHASIDEMDRALRTYANGSGAGTTTALTNKTPNVDAGPNRTIPANTPFELTGQAYDLQGNDLTYTWEQYDLGIEQNVGTDAGNGPLFRSREGTKDTTRTFPEVADIIANRSDADELLPSVARSVDPLTFRLTVRDQLGGVSDDVIDLPVVNTGAAFAITSQNAAGTTWNVGSTQTITWNVAGTTANGINTANVDIFISVDDGATFTPVLLGTPNDGSQAITVPANLITSPSGRVKVKGAGNYFFDINNAAISIAGTAPLNGLPTTAPAVEGTLYAGRGGSIKNPEVSTLAFDAFIDFAGDTDTYLYSPPVTGTYTIETGFSGAPTVDTVLSVYDDVTGAPLAINDDFAGSSVTSRVTITLEAGKRYRISVGDFGSNSSGDVILTLSSTAVAPLTNTISLNAAGDGSTTGSLASSRSANFHEFVVPTLYDGSGTITVTAPDASTVLSLYDTAGNLLAYTTGGSFSNLSLATLVPGSTVTLRVGTQGYASGGGAYTVAVNFGIVGAAVRPDLPNFADTGISDTDNITNQGPAGLGMFVPALEAGRFYRLFRDGVLVAGPTQAIAAGGSLSMPDPGPLSNGTYVYTSTVAATATSPQTPASTGLTVTVDATAPSWVSEGFNFNTPSDHYLIYGFNEPVFGFTNADPVVTNTTTNQQISSSVLTVAPQSSTLYYVSYNPTAANNYFPDGRYLYDLPTGAVTDTAGNQYITEFPSAFFFLNGDANRDAAINFDDLLILAANYNTSGKTFTQGDFTYDGTVNFDDLLILAAKYNTSLPAGSPAPAPILGSPSGGGDDEDSRGSGDGAASVLE